MIQPAESLAEAARSLKEAALGLGFSQVGIAPARLPAAEVARLEAWLAEGRQGMMGWLAKGAAGRCDAGTLLEGAESVVMVALPYPAAEELPGEASGTAVVSTYAQAPTDYHRVIAPRLGRLIQVWEQLVPGARARRFCDTAPLLERAFALRAGLGFVGKNTQLIDPRRGSFFFLGGLILDRRLPADAIDEVSSCGSCTRCLEACPTDAFPEPYVLDARRCISYLTIEHRGPYAEELRAQVGGHVFGCDVCQTVCPWNAKFAAASDAELEADPARRAPDLLALAEQAQASFKGLARGTPWARATKRGFLRNLATAMGNRGDARHEGVLEALSRHEDPGVADHARWARSRLRPPHRGDRMRLPSDGEEPR